MVISSRSFQKTVCNSRITILSRPKVFCKKGVHKNFLKFTGIHLCQSLFFKKIPGLKPASLLKKRLWHRCFPANFAKFLRTPFFIEHLQRLFLDLWQIVFMTVVNCFYPSTIFARELPRRYLIGSQVHFWSY